FARPPVAYAPPIQLLAPQVMLFDITIALQGLSQLARRRAAETDSSCGSRRGWTGPQLRSMNLIRVLSLPPKRLDSASRSTHIQQTRCDGSTKVSEDRGATSRNERRQAR